MSMVDPKHLFKGASKFCDCEDEHRICDTCSEELPVNFNIQYGYYCCDFYYCSDKCLITGTRFDSMKEWIEDHYTDDGDCYWTEWEL
jgi:hypothetical protein